MIFLIFLVSIGTMHVILAADSRQNRRRTVTHPGSSQAVKISPPPPAADAPAPQSAPELWALMTAIEQHGRGEKPDTEVPQVPTVGRTAPKDC